MFLYTNKLLKVHTQRYCRQALNSTGNRSSLAFYVKIINNEWNEHEHRSHLFLVFAIQYIPRTMCFITSPDIETNFLSSCISSLCESHLHFSVGVVCSGVHQVQDKELDTLTEMLALQCGKV